jgi:hypothetical protein
MSLSEQCARCAVALPVKGGHRRLVRYDRRNRYEKFCAPCAESIDDANRIRYSMKDAKPKRPR